MNFPIRAIGNAPLESGSTGFGTTLPHLAFGATHMEPQKIVRFADNPTGDRSLSWRVDSWRKLSVILADGADECLLISCSTLPGF